MFLIYINTQRQIHDVLYCWSLVIEQPPVVKTAEPTDDLVHLNGWFKIISTLWRQAHSISVKTEVIWGWEVCSLTKAKLYRFHYFQWRHITLTCYVTAFPITVPRPQHTFAVLNNLLNHFLNQWNTFGEVSSGVRNCSRWDVRWDHRNFSIMSIHEKTELVAVSIHSTDCFLNDVLYRCYFLCCCCRIWGKISSVQEGTMCTMSNTC